MTKSSKIKMKDLKIILNSTEANNICFNNEDYWSIVKNLDKFDFDPNDKRFDLKRGLYATVGDMGIWVSKSVVKGYLKIYPKDKLPQTNADLEWSIDIKISEFEKVIKLKAFW